VINDGDRYSEMDPDSARAGRVHRIQSIPDMAGFFLSFPPEQEDRNSCTSKADVHCA
jgi:hypothetical protein